MTTCPDTGTLRALLDDEAPPAAAEHARACPRCDAELDTLRQDATFARAALDLLAAAPAHRVAPRPVGAGPTAPRGPQGRDDLRGARRARRRLAGQRFTAAAAVFALSAVVIATPVGREAAASFLAQFRSERLSVLEIDPQFGYASFSILGALGTLEGAENLGAIEGLPDVAAAEERLGAPLAVPDPALIPEQFDSQPQVLYSQPVEVRLDFDRASVESWIAQHGGGPEIPEGLDDTTLVVDVPAAVMLSYNSQSIERLVVGQSALLTAETVGPVGLDGVRAFLLELPGLPPEVVTQLADIDDWRSTLPLPVPTGMIDWEEINVGGTDAVTLSGTGGLGSAVLWQSDGWVRGVGGLVDEDTALSLAADLMQ